MADIDTAAIRAVYGVEFADGTVYDLCGEVDALRGRLAEAETALNEKRGVAVRFKNLYIEALARAEAAEATIDECGCQTEAGWAEHDRVRALEARLAAVEAERDALRRIIEAVEYVTDQNAHMCSMCKEEVRAALAGEAAPPPGCFGPQDEEAAKVCGAHGCSNRATGMRKSHVPGWADVPDCGMHPQRAAGSGRAAERGEGDRG